MRVDVEVNGRKLSAVSAEERAAVGAAVEIDCRKALEIPAGEAAPAEGGPQRLRIPVTAETLSEQDMDQFRREFARSAGPIAVVSATGRRAAAVVLAHAGRVQGWTPDDTFARCPAVGQEPALAKFVREYLERHADQAERRDGNF